MEIVNERLQQYVKACYRNVEGWLQLPVVWALSHVSAELPRFSANTASCEIGVHHGRFFLALENVTDPNAPCYAVDVFDQQRLNVDHSGGGTLKVFSENVEAFAIAPERVECRSLDSTSADASAFFRSIEGKVGLFSIDGGHTRNHVGKDLRSAEETLAPGGVVFLDDFFNPNWPGVTEGVADYLKGGGGLLPIATIGGKMLLSQISFANHYAAYLHKAALGDQGTSPKWVTFCGHQYPSILPIQKK